MRPDDPSYDTSFHGKLEDRPACLPARARAHSCTRLPVLVTASSSPPRHVFRFHEKRPSQSQCLRYVIWRYDDAEVQTSRLPQRSVVQEMLTAPWCTRDSRGTSTGGRAIPELRPPIPYSTMQCGGEYESRGAQDSRGTAHRGLEPRPKGQHPYPDTLGPGAKFHEKRKIRSGVTVLLERGCPCPTRPGPWLGVTERSLRKRLASTTRSAARPPPSHHRSSRRGSGGPSVSTTMSEAGRRAQCA